MTTDPAEVGAGELFEWHTVIGGVRIELLAEVETDGTTLHLKDIAVFPAGVDRAEVGLGPLVAAARRDLFPKVRSAGFRRLRVTAVRRTGARPGRIVDLSIDLERQLL